MKVSIIIVNFNTGKILMDCIESIYNFENPYDFELIIADNNSTDDSEKLINEISVKYKEIKSIFLKEKISFSEANNIGFNNSTGEYILIMNPDIIFTEPLLEKLISDLNGSDNLGAVSPLLIGSDGEFQRAYFQRYPSLMQFVLFYSIFGNAFKNNQKLVNKYQNNGDINTLSGKIENTDQIPCAFFFTTKNVFEKAGRMDKNYFLFFEDVDLSYQVNKNFRLGVDTKLKVRHLGGASFKTADDYWLYGRFIMSMIIFFKKNYSPLKTFILKLMAATNSNIIILLEHIKKLFGEEDEYRLRKHEYFMKEFRKTYY